ncbi:MAG TPA: type II toxin-antitoxin system VapC family toxin [Nitrososphaerales archaeon]|nr:type II toxin-antitoxin system VapC family toxin [Nitrososphaerales archaeon]
MRVIDSSSLGKFVNKEANWREVAKLIEFERVSTLEFALKEVGNSIWKRVIGKEIQRETALSVFREFMRSVFEDGLVSLVPTDENLLNSSLKLAIEERITIYDAVFIELAFRNKWGLLTSDGRQMEICKKRYDSIPVVYLK